MCKFRYEFIQFSSSHLATLYVSPRGTIVSINVICLFNLNFDVVDSGAESFTQHYP